MDQVAAGEGGAGVGGASAGSQPDGGAAGDNGPGPGRAGGGWSWWIEGRLLQGPAAVIFLAGPVLIYLGIDLGESAMIIGGVLLIGIICLAIAWWYYRRKSAQAARAAQAPPSLSL